MSKRQRQQEQIRASHCSPDETARNEARSIPFHAYRKEPTFQYLFDFHRRPRLRSAGPGHYTGTDRSVPSLIRMRLA